MNMPTRLSIQDLEVGTLLPPLVIKPTAVSLFRFSAVTWNPHRIHYDAAYALTEGYPDVLVHSHLHGCWLAECVISWAGSGAVLREFSWQNRDFAVPGDELTVTGQVVGIKARRVECELAETNQRGELCAPGRAVIELPEGTGE